ncbi:MAG: hypothetical protein N2442_02515 [Spirochaetes bacterium]|nr:hypothetical protein [Spirochaetota bacterium]
MGKIRRVFLIGLSVGIWGFLRGVSSAQPQEYWRSQLDSELSLNGTLSTRWLLDFEQSRILFLEQRSPEEDPYRIVGLSSPFFSIGPMDLSGLLREAGSPLSYTLSGTVFREQTGIQLYTGKDLYTRIGFAVAGPDRSLSVGGYKDPGGEPHLFATFHLGSTTQFPSIEGFVSLTDRQPESIELDWFPSKSRVLPGPLIHWGNRVRLGLEAPLRGSLTLSMVGSRPSHDLMGVFTHLYGELFLSWIEVKALLGYCTSHYVTPKGERTPKEVQNAIGGTLFPLYPFFLSIEGEEVGFRDREVTRSIRIGGGIQGPAFRFEAQREERVEKTGWILEGWGRLGRFFGHLTASWEERDKGSETSLFIRGIYSANRWEGDLWWKGIWNPTFMVEGGGTISLKQREWKIGISVEILKPIGLRDEDVLRFSLNPLSFVGISLFFSAYDSHLPRKIISGSRGLP